MQAKCANCETPNGPFEKERMHLPLCKLNKLDECKKRRDALDRKNWIMNKGEVLIKDE